jgi:hypothetical protein
MNFPSVKDVRKNTSSRLIGKTNVIAKTAVKTFTLSIGKNRKDFK